MEQESNLSQCAGPGSEVASPIQQNVGKSDVAGVPPQRAPFAGRGGLGRGFRAPPWVPAPPACAALAGEEGFRHGKSLWPQAEPFVVAGCLPMAPLHDVRCASTLAI